MSFGDGNLRERVEQLERENVNLKAKLKAYEDEYCTMELVVRLDEVMKFTTDPPGYVKKVIYDLKAENERLKRQLNAQRNEEP